MSRSVEASRECCHFGDLFQCPYRFTAPVGWRFHPWLDVCDDLHRSTRAQGEDLEFDTSGSNENRGLGSALQRFFGPRDTQSERRERNPTVAADEAGLLQGGFIKQLRGTNQSNDEQPPSRSESAGVGQSDLGSAIPPAPSQMAQRPAREPFSTPSPVRSTPNTRPPVERDVFASIRLALSGRGSIRAGRLQRVPIQSNGVERRSASAP